MSKTTSGSSVSRKKKKKHKKLLNFNKLKEYQHTQSKNTTKIPSQDLLPF